jgi:hypothetical protein
MEHKLGQEDMAIVMDLAIHAKAHGIIILEEAFHTALIFLAINDGPVWLLKGLVMLVCQIFSLKF